MGCLRFDGRIGARGGSIIPSGGYDGACSSARSIPARVRIRADGQFQDIGDPEHPDARAYPRCPAERVSVLIGMEHTGPPWTPPIRRYRPPCSSS